MQQNRHYGSSLRAAKRRGNLQPFVQSTPWRTVTTTEPHKPVIPTERSERRNLLEQPSIRSTNRLSRCVLCQDRPLPLTADTQGDKRNHLAPGGICSVRYRVMSSYKCRRVPSPSFILCARFGYDIIEKCLLCFISSLTSASKL